MTSYFGIPILYDKKDIFFLVLVLEDLIGLHRTIKLPQHWLSWHRLG